MSSTATIRLRRLAAPVAFAATVSAATVGGVALPGSSSGSGIGTVTGTQPSVVSGASAAQIRRDPVGSAARVALDRLAAAGTISQAQANKVEQYVIAGSIDPAALVNGGLVTNAQMQAIAATLDQVKRSVS